MSRSKRGGRSIASWLTARADGADGRFIQVGNSLLLSKQFQDLSAGARYTYFCFCMESGGKREFIFPLSAAKKYGIPKNSLTRHIAELAAAGFISAQSGRSVRQPNLYAFEFAWKAKGMTD